MKEGESIFDYYNSSARDEVSEKREKLELWVSRFPEGEQKEYRARVRKSSQEFLACELEILIHEMMVQNGYQAEVHPKIDNENRVDFFASKADSAFYLEATTVQDDAAEIASANRRARLVDRVNQIKMPTGHVLGFDIVEEDSDSPKIASFVAKIEDTLRDRCPLEPGAKVTVEFQANGWRVEVDIVSTGSDKQYERAIGFLQGKGGFIDPSGDLRVRLDKKSKRYGKPDAPFVLAICDLKNPIFDNEDYIETAFGDQVTAFNVESKEAFNYSRFNGFFGYQEAPKNKHISAIAFFPSNPYWAATVGEKEPILIHNPFATYALPLNALGLTSLYFDEEQILRTSIGTKMSQMIL